MSYIDPSKVISPKSSVSAVRVIEDKKEGSFSIARLRYDQREELACRWNGGDDEPSGHPNSRGIPTWFLIPPQMREDVLEGVFKRARKERPQIFDEINLIKNEFSHSGMRGTAVTIHPFIKDLTLSDANLLVELIKKDDELKLIHVDVFEMDSEGNRTNDPISQIAGKLHITLLQEFKD